mmetsp:Transcript_19382/g.36015  ORF Transcript_19382/g.36015 Transcript_19382/m.36015 type:complete len:357 (-) Transcript_19382:1302-2372(-)
MLLHGEFRVEDIVLRAHPEIFPNLAHLGGDVLPVNKGGARGGVDKAREHGDRRGLARAVVAQQASDLVLEHLQVKPVDGVLDPGGSVEALAEILDADTLAPLYGVQELRPRILYAGPFLEFAKQLVAVGAVPPAPKPVPGIDAEEGVLVRSPLAGKHILAVPRHEGPEKNVKNQHHEAKLESVAVLVRSGVPSVSGYSHGGVFVLNEGVDAVDERGDRVDARYELHGETLALLHALGDDVAAEVNHDAHNGGSLGPAKEGRDPEAEGKDSVEVQEKVGEDERQGAVEEQLVGQRRDDDAEEPEGPAEVKDPSARVGPLSEAHHLHPLLDLRLLLQHKFPDHSGNWVHERDGDEYGE